MIQELRFELRFLHFLKIRVRTLSILCGIKNQINPIKSQVFIQKWSALIEIFKKVVGHFDFWNLKMAIRSSKLHFLQVVCSQEVKKFSRIAMPLIFFSSESCDVILFEYLKNGAQNGAPDWQFCIEWKKFNLNFTWFLRLFWAPGLQELRFELRSCMSKFAEELSSSL